jgi:hypothetical protein
MLVAPNIPQLTKEEEAMIMLNRQKSLMNNIAPHSHTPQGKVISTVGPLSKPTQPIAPTTDPNTIPKFQPMVPVSPDPSQGSDITGPLAGNKDILEDYQEKINMTPTTGGKA